ncbi:MAG: helix-turn-helix transcriptional regulator [Thermodesulfobacteriota bacterium]
MDRIFPGLSARLASLVERKAGGNWRQFAIDAGVAPTTLQGLKEGDPAPKSETAYRIAQFAGVSVEWLLTGKRMATDLVQLKEGPPPPPDAEVVEVLPKGATYPAATRDPRRPLTAPEAAAALIAALGAPWLDPYDVIARVSELAKEQRMSGSAGMEGGSRA